MSAAHSTKVTQVTTWNETSDSAFSIGLSTSNGPCPFSTPQVEIAPTSSTALQAPGTRNRIVAHARKGSGANTQAIDGRALAAGIAKTSAQTAASALPSAAASKIRRAGTGLGPPRRLTTPCTMSGTSATIANVLV